MTQRTEKPFLPEEPSDEGGSGAVVQRRRQLGRALWDIWRRLLSHEEGVEEHKPARERPSVTAMGRRAPLPPPPSSPNDGLTHI